MPTLDKNRDAVARMMGWQALAAFFLEETQP